MVSPSRVLEFANRVKKTSGGRAWLPKFGFTGMTKTQKATRKKNVKQEHEAMAALREAAANEPKAPLA